MEMRNIVWLLYILLCGCVSEHDLQNEDNETVKLKGIELKELIPSDSRDVVSIKTFNFDDGILTSYIASQEIDGGNLFKHSIMTGITYSDNEVVMSDDNGNVWTYLTDECGFAKSCLLEEGGTERLYSFSYTEDCDGRTVLAGVTEAVDGGAIYSSMELDYSEEGVIKVTQRVDGVVDSYILEFDSDVAVANEYALPDLFLSELYPLSMHFAALYGGLLGEAYGFLSTGMYPEYSPDLQEHTYYNYSSDGLGVLNGCEMVTVSGGEEYVRNIDIKLTL